MWPWSTQNPSKALWTVLRIPVLFLKKIYCRKGGPVDIKDFSVLKINYEDFLLVRHTTASEANYYIL